MTRIPLSNLFQIGLAWDFKKKETPIDLDASIVGLNSAEKIVDQVCFSKLVGFGGAIRHSGDDRTGDGDGDDEVITIDAGRLNSNVEKLVVCINSYSGESLSKVKSAYIRVIVDGRTHAFYMLGKGRVPNCTGLLFGIVQRWTHGWEFVTTVVPANGRTVQESTPGIIRWGKANLGW